MKKLIISSQDNIKGERAFWWLHKIFDSSDCRYDGSTQTGIMSFNYMNVDNHSNTKVTYEFCDEDLPQLWDELSLIYTDYAKKLRKVLQPYEKHTNK